MIIHVAQWVGTPHPRSQSYSKNKKHTLKTGAALFYYKLDHALPRIIAVQLLQIKANAVRKWSRHTSWVNVYDKLGQVLQI